MIAKAGTMLCQKYHCGLDLGESMSGGVKESDLERGDVCAFLYSFSLFICTCPLKT